MGTSMRIGEVLAVRPRDIDFDAVVPSRKRPEKRKTGQSGRLGCTLRAPSSRSMAKLIRQPEPERDRQERAMRVPRVTEEVLRRRSAGLAPDRLLFATRTGEPYGSPTDCSGAGARRLKGWRGWNRAISRRRKSHTCSCAGQRRRELATSSASRLLAGYSAKASPLQPWCKLTSGRQRLWRGRGVEVSGASLDSANC